VRVRTFRVLHAHNWCIFNCFSENTQNDLPSRKKRCVQNETIIYEFIICSSLSEHQVKKTLRANFVFACFHTKQLPRATPFQWPCIFILHWIDCRKRAWLRNARPVLAQLKPQRCNSSKMCDRLFGERSELLPFSSSPLRASWVSDARPGRDSKIRSERCPRSSVPSRATCNHFLSADTRTFWFSDNVWAPLFDSVWARSRILIRSRGNNGLLSSYGCRWWIRLIVPDINDAKRE